MSGHPEPADEARWPALFRRGRDPLFVLNRRRRLVFANTAWERLTHTTFADARGMTFTRRETGHALAELGRTLAPPPDVLGGRTAAVRRPPPGRGSGPPWWDVDFLPLTDEDRLLGVVGRIRVVEPPALTARTPLPAAWGQLRAQAVGRWDFAAWESAAAALQRAVAQTRLVAETGCPAVIVGEPGTGKRSLARTIHAASARREFPFVGLDCERLPPAAVRAVLAGPLGLTQADRVGLIYLGNPAALPLDLQADIARRPGERPQLIAGFPADPHDALRAGRLSEDLFAALAVVVMELPALRDCVADWPRLADRALRGAAESAGKPRVELTGEAAEALRGYAWPGNLDELAATLRGAAAKATGETISLADLPLAVRPVPPEPLPRAALPPLDKLLEQVEGRMIRLALDRAKGNKSKAADLLGVWRPRLLRRMAVLGIADAEG